MSLNNRLTKKEHILSNMQQLACKNRQQIKSETLIIQMRLLLRQFKNLMDIDISRSDTYAHKWNEN